MDDQKYSMDNVKTSRNESSKSRQSCAIRALGYNASNLERPAGYKIQLAVVWAAWSIVVVKSTGTNDFVLGAALMERQTPAAYKEQGTPTTSAVGQTRVVLDWEATVKALLCQLQFQGEEMVAVGQSGLRLIQRIDAELEHYGQFQLRLVVRAVQAGDTDPMFFTATADDNMDDGTVETDAFDTSAMMLVCQLQGQSVHLRIDFDSNVVEPMLIERVARQFEHIWHQLWAKECQTTKVKDIETLSQQDLHDIWQRNANVPSAIEMCVHDLLAETTRRQPEAVAIYAWDGELTYGQLDELSTRLAYYLVEQGVGPAVVVPLYFEKSMWMPVAMLAVMKAGGASIAIDATQPQERLQSIIQQATSLIILSSLAQEARARQLATSSVIVVNAERIDQMTMFSATPLPKIVPSDKMCIVFTSGSTGLPKGAVLTHRNFSTAIINHVSVFDLDSTSRVYDFASYSFDFAWSNFLLTIYSGGCLCIPSESQRINDLVGSVNQCRATFLFSTPSLIRTLDPNMLPHLKTIVLGGEHLLRADVRQWLDRAKVLNIYGPCECTVMATCSDVQTTTDQDKTVGFGVETNLWVLDTTDTRGRLASIGEEGELYLEGPLVGLGYLNDPERTAATFIEDPPWLLQGGGSHPGRHGRLYKTGDLVRYNADGSLAILGRKDTQVKIRGQRVELGEVEYHVQQLLDDKNMHSAVDGIQVVAEVITPQRGKNSVLVAFICLGNGNESRLTEEDRTTIVQRITTGLEERLSEKVPPYMIPSAYIPIQAIPMTATGKTDRRSLRERGSLTYWDRQLNRQPKRLAPSNEMEMTLLEVWMEVLNLPAEAISTDTSFTRLGGDSITGMQVVSWCRARNIAIHVGDLLREKTIQHIARCCTPVAHVCPAAVEEEERAWLLSPIQQMFFDIYQPSQNHFNQSFLLKLTRPVSGFTLKKTLQGVIARHSMLRARFRQNHIGQWEQFLAKTTPQAFAFAEHTLRPRTTLYSVVKERQESLDIQHGPVFAADLFNISGEGQVLFLVAHHLVIDLVSWRILLHEIEQTLCTGNTFHLKTLPFQTWGKLQYESSQSLNPTQVLPFRTVASQFEYWNLSWSENRYSEAEYYQKSLDAQTTSLLLGCGNDSFRTEPTDILVATLIHSFRQAFPDRKAPALFLEGHGRESLDDAEIDLSETVGWFTTIHPLQIPGEATDTNIDTVKFTKDIRRRVPGKGRPYFACRYQNPVGREEFKQHAAMELLLNYTGIYQQLESASSLFQVIDRPETPTSGDMSSAAQRLALIEVTAGIERSSLVVTFGVNRRMQHQARLRNWAELFVQSLKHTVFNLAKRAMSWTLSDFPLLSLSYRGLECLIKDRLPGAGVDVRNVQDMYPCMPIQEGILLSRQREVASYANFWVWQCIPVNHGELISPSRLVEAWETVVRRHSILASTFVADPDSSIFVQVLLRDPKSRLSYESVESKGPIEVLLEMNRPLFRPGEPEHAFTICKASNGLVACRLDINHTLIDAASIPILIGDLAKIYSGTGLPLAPPFRDLIQYIGRTARSQKLAYWTQFLQGVQTCEFPINKTSISHDSYGLIALPNSAARGINAFCRDREITRSVFLQLAWALVLSRYTGMSQICFGYLASGRDAPIDRIGQMVGPLISMLISRIDLRRPLEEIAVTTSRRTIEHFAFQHMSLAEILRGLTHGGKKIFNTAMTVREVDRNEDMSAEKIRFEEIAKDDPHEFDIVVEAGLARDRTEVSISYRKLTISEHAARGAASILGTAVAYLLRLTPEGFTDPASFDTCKVSDEQMERMQTYIADSPTIDSLVHDLIKKHAYERPDSVAICSWDGQLSYEELDLLSLRLAYRLRTANVGPEVMVCILFEKSLWAIVAMMAVMKAGGVFVPLDPSYPKERLKCLIQRTAAGLLLCSKKYASLFRETFDEIIVVGRSSLRELSQVDSTLPEANSKNGVYMMFTSGSTGKPKGCVLEHSACCSTIVQLAKSFGITSCSRVLQFSSYGFDVCIVEIFSTLLVGGCVCVPSESIRLNGIIEFIRNTEVNFAFLTPSFSRIINPESVPTLKTLVLTGEKPAQKDIDRWFGKLRLFQGYGSTESCVICVVNEFTDRGSMASQIGRGIIGFFVVVSEADQLTPMDTIGELYIGGPNLARGYFNDCEKTAAAFRDDGPWARDLNSATKRFYKTGDLVKMRSDGIIEYLGRKDSQVKIRGQRVELGEVEHHMRQSLASVVDLAVEVITPVNDLQNPRLAAFLCLDDDQHSNRFPVVGTFIAKEPIPSDILTRVSDHLLMSLPPYMVPSLLIPLKAIPLSTSGKRDRQKLQCIAAELTIEELITYSSDHQEKLAPVTESEKVLHRLWARILDIPPNMIGLNENFIRLGGDSIFAMKLVAASREKGLILSVADVFRSPRLRDLAVLATGADFLSDRNDTMPSPFTLIGGVEKAEGLYPEIISQCNIRASMIEDIYPCTPFQEGIMVLSVKQPGTYILQRSFELSSDLILDLKRFCLAWEAVVDLNPILRTRIIQSETAGLVQIVVKEPIQWAFENDLDDYFRKNKQCLMGFGSPLGRYAIVRPITGKNEKYHLCWTTHHAIYDGWSIALILKQVDQQYRLLRSESLLQRGLKEPSRRPLKFNTFIKALQDVDVHESESFWREYFINGEPKTFPYVQSESLCLPTESLETRIKLSRKSISDLTISTIIQTAWAMIVSKYANCDDVVFGTTLSGRTGSIAEVELIVGPTITTVPVRILLDPSRLVADFLREVQEQALDMIPFQHIGLANIRRINSNSDFQNLLIIQPKAEAEIDGILLNTRLQTSSHVGTFDTYALTMECSLNEEGLAAQAIFDPQVISKTQMERIMFQFQHILRQLCIGGNKIRLQDIQTISPEDHNTVWRWNAALPSLMESCVHSLIEQKMVEEPDAQAICAWDGELSYGDLNMQSSRLAHHLIGMGVGPEITVPILFDKSKWVVVAILGILRAGGAFVPLEPSHPPARLALIVDQLKATVFVCSEGHRDMCSNRFPNCNILVLDDLEFVRLPEIDTVPYVEVFSTNAVYVIFTSGTTGTPKGVVIEHGSYCSSARDHSKALHFDRISRHLQFASHSFDTSIEDILTTLLTGGCICIPSEAERNQDLVGAINRMNVTRADLTPSFLSHIEIHDVQNLKILILGGEPLTTKIIKTWANHVRLINAYGISECCVTNVVNSNINPDTDPANIGRAVGGVCWIVDARDHDKLAPVGTIGELVIEGPTLARGYLNDELKTRAAFINAPAWAREENGIRRPQRLYKTGDLAQYTSDGSISYMGRKDTQIKIRGQRVELFEVEKHLVNHYRVENAMVLLPNSGPCVNVLTAVVQPRSMVCSANPNDFEILTELRLQEIGLEWSELSAYLNERLPAYMIPIKWIALKHLPLHVSKKLSRSKIASWLAQLSNEQQFVDGPIFNEMSPLTADETVALKISHKIADLLSDSSVSETISGHDATLSRIGMDSIRMTSLAAFIKRSFGVAIPMQKLISNQITIRDISRHIFDAKTGVETQAIPQLDLMTEFRLLNSRLNSSRKPRPRLGAVFLTGATGFLGTQILRQLLHRLEVGKVIAHVRAENPDYGRQRVIASAQAAKWWSDALSSKLEIWIGDLARPRLGLTSDQWEALGKFDAIIHNGAAVQWNADYYALKPANVISTMELLSIATSPNCDRLPRFIYVSGGRYFEDELNEDEAAKLLSSVEGYSQTKFVSELLVKQFVQGPDAEHIHIVKPGLIIGTAREGVANKNDFLWRFVSGVLNVGGFTAQQGEDDWLFISSADRVAAAVMECLVKSTEEARGGRVISIPDGVPLQEVWTVLNHDLGYELRPMSHSEWMRKLQKDVQTKMEKHPLWPVMHLLQEGSFASKRPKMEVSQETMDSIKAAIQKNVEFLIDTGFFLAPAGVLVNGHH